MSSFILVPDELNKNSNLLTSFKSSYESFGPKNDKWPLARTLIFLDQKAQLLYFELRKANATRKSF